MTAEEQRFAIAEACELKPVRVPNKDAKVWLKLDKPDDRGNAFCTCPNYPADLNAMHRAVDWANANQPDWWNDEHFLQTLCGWTGGYPHRATAAQWAEAFLRIAGKWQN